MTCIVWFRQDLRCNDNPALAWAAARGPVVPVYILDNTPPPAGRPIGGAGQWWLDRSLRRHAETLGGLVLLRGDPKRLLPELARQVDAQAVAWTRCYEPAAIARDKDLKGALAATGLDVKSFNGQLLHEPWEVKTLSGGPFKVYSAFWRACCKRAVAQPGAQPRFKLADIAGIGDRLDDWGLAPRNPDWAAGWDSLWTPGEIGASARLEGFLANGLAGYAELRDRPDRPNISRLSAHLHWGEISPRTIWTRVQHAAAGGDVPARDAEKFLAEIGWREFATHLLYHFPELPERNWRPEFDAYPWRDSASDLKAWQRGRTGYPMVDAGLRELWATGFMHNRVRMIAASFLIKHLRIDWRQGERWFWDTLLDADLANNAASWQWVAGSGADASPYFRIFNPVTQGRKFDPEGHYVRRWCPELARLPNDVLHAPFEAPPEVLREAGVELGKTYPHPIVEHRAAREAALRGYDAVKAR